MIHFIIGCHKLFCSRVFWPCQSTSNLIFLLPAYITTNSNYYSNSGVVLSHYHLNVDFEVSFISSNLSWSKEWWAGAFVLLLFLLRRFVDLGLLGLVSCYCFGWRWSLMGRQCDVYSLVLYVIPYFTHLKVLYFTVARLFIRLNYI